MGALAAEQHLVHAPLLHWYIDHGLKITASYRTIDYTPQPIVKCFIKEFTESRRMGDTDKSKALLAEIGKLLEHSAYAKCWKLSSDKPTLPIPSMKDRQTELYSVLGSTISRR